MITKNFTVFRDFLRSRGYTGQINEAQYQFLLDEGYNAGQLMPMWGKYLTAEGYSGHLSTKARQFIEDYEFSPSVLFNTGEQGTALTPGPANCFQDSAGTTPAGAGDPVGLVLDTSQGAGYAGGTFTGLGPELVTNGGFDADSDWAKDANSNGSVVISDGVLRITSDGGDGFPGAYQAFATIVGRTYSVSTSYANNTTGAWLRKSDSAGTTGGGNRVTLLTNNKASSGSAVGSFMATATTTYISLFAERIDAGSVDFDNVSVREIPGNHATQDVNDDYRPTLEQDGSGNWYLDFDGVDDYLYIPNLDMTASDKVTVWAAVRKNSDAAIGMAVELSGNSNSNDGSFRIAAPVSAGVDDYQFLSRGTISAAVTPTGFPAPTTNVLTGIGDISGDSTILRVDGVQAGSSAANQGTGNYGSYPLYFGARAGSSLFSDVRAYGLIIRGGASTDAEITKTERYMARLSGVTL